MGSSKRLADLLYGRSPERDPWLRLQWFAYITIRNPQRIQPRTVFDMALGDNNIAHFGESERYRFSASVTAINVANKYAYALYNFLSTFSGTHYLRPRTVTGEIAFHF